MNRDMAYKVLQTLSAASLALTTLQYTGDTPYALHDSLDTAHAAIHTAWMAVLEELNPTNQPIPNEVFDFA